LKLTLTTLDTRRIRGDIIEVFKILNGFENLNPCSFFTLSTAPTRDHSIKLVKPRRNKFSFAHRIIDIWNSLDENIVACDLLNSFRHRIENLLKCCGFI